MDLQDGVAIVTGSSSGVGAATARQLAERGANVVINYAHNEDGAQATQEACEAFGVETVVVKADVA
ncbi:MAG: SDR family NAD(P)-dependent oxidoreductase, partial [Pseudomonadales bacterium]